MNFQMNFEMILCAKTLQLYIHSRILIRIMRRCHVPPYSGVKAMRISRLAASNVLAPVQSIVFIVS